MSSVSLEWKEINTGDKGLATNQIDCDLFIYRGCCIEQMSVKMSPFGHALFIHFCEILMDVLALCEN